MKTKIGLSAVLLLIVGLIISSCANIEKRDSISNQELKALSATSTKQRDYNYLRGTPLLYNTVDGATSTVSLFLTPSCEFCIDMYNSIFRRGILNTVAFERTNFFIFLVPRVSEDETTIKTLMCAPEGAFAIAVHKYFKDMGAIEDDSVDLLRKAHEVSTRTIKLLVVTDEQLSSCRENPDFDITIDESWKTGWELNENQEWPLVLINDDPADVEDVNQIIEAVQ